jgi:tetratricopeptide (TPR) repeat protein
MGAIFVLLFCVISTLAQTQPANKPASNDAKPTVPAPQDKSSARAAESSAEPDGDDSTATKSTAQDTGAPVVDRLAALRDQIASAKTEGERTRLRRTLVDYLVALNKKSEAINELRSMSHEERLDPIGFYNIGNALARLGDTDSAIESYRKAIKQRHGNYARALNNLGVLLLKQSHWDEAQESFISALRLEDSRYAEASYNLGRVYSMRGEADMAIREWSRALIVQPDHADAAIALARAYAEEGNAQRGLGILDAFISRRGSSPELTAARREILFGGETGAETSSTKDPGASATSSSGSTKSGNDKHSSPAPRHLTVDQQTYDLLQSARAAREDARNEEAITLYGRVLSRNDGYFPPANLELSFVLTALKRYDEAVAVLATLVGREGARYPIAYYHIGRQYEALGQLDRAAEAFENAIAAFGDANPQFLLDLSRVREKQGNLVAAAAAMESYIRINASLGRVHDWSTKRLAELRQKIAVSSGPTPAPEK